METGKIPRSSRGGGFPSFTMTPPPFQVLTAARAEHGDILRNRKSVSQGGAVGWSSSEG